MRESLRFERVILPLIFSVERAQAVSLRFDSTPQFELRVERENVSARAQPLASFRSKTARNLVQNVVRVELSACRASHPSNVCIADAQCCAEALLLRCCLRDPVSTFVVSDAHARSLKLGIHFTLLRQQLLGARTLIAQRI